MSTSYLLLAFILPFLLNCLLTPFILFVSHRFSWFDQVDHRKVHNGEVPRLGGVGFFLSFMLTLGVFFVGFSDVSFNFSLFMLFSGFFLIHLLGLLDDFRNIPARYKLVGQLVAASLVVLGGAILPGISFGGFFLSFGFLAPPLTVFWLISLSNAVNLIDGIDGLAGGTSFISAIIFGIMHLLIGSSLGSFFAFTLAGALLGFLVFNKPKAKIFMGDSGSLFLGFVLGSLFLVGIQPTDQLAFSGIGVTLVILVIPVIDMVAAILRRVRKKQAIFSPDKEHIHHKLLNFGYSVPRILFLLYGWVLSAGSLVLLWSWNLRQNGGVSTPLNDLLLLIAWAGSVGIFLTIHYKNKNLGKSAG